MKTDTGVEINMVYCSPAMVRQLAQASGLRRDSRVDVRAALEHSQLLEANASLGEHGVWFTPLHKLLTSSGKHSLDRQEQRILCDIVSDRPWRRCARRATCGLCAASRNVKHVHW